MMGRISSAALATVIFAFTATQATAQDPADVVVKTEHVRGNIYALFATGGNIGVSVGDDGVFLIDDQYAPLTAKILAAIAAISDQPVRYLINTHYHGDHTGGNENLGKAGTMIIAHDNVRAQLMARPLNRSGGWTGEHGTVGLPVITFNDQLSFHLNGEEARAIHVDNAHTDGDSFIHFKDANVIHTGDLMFNGLFPYIDINGGGNVDGVLNGYDQILALADAQTRIIPGHGPMATRDDLVANRAMIQTVRDRVAAMIGEGQSLEAIVAAGPAAEYASAYNWQFIDAAKFVTAVYQSLEKEK